MKMINALLLGAGLWFVTDGFKRNPLGGKDANDPVGSRNEISPRVTDPASGGVLDPTVQITLDPQYGIDFVPGGADNPWVYEDVMIGGGWGGGLNPPSYGLPGSEFSGFSA